MTHSVVISTFICVIDFDLLTFSDPWPDLTRCKTYGKEVKRYSLIRFNQSLLMKNTDIYNVMDCNSMNYFPPQTIP